MMLTFAWRKLISSVFGSTTTPLSNRKARHKRAAAVKERARAALVVEPLETRLVPSTLSFTNATGALSISLIGGDTVELYGTTTAAGDVTVVNSTTTFAYGPSNGATNNHPVTSITITSGDGSAGEEVTFDDNGGANTSVNLGTTAGDDITIDGTGNTLAGLTVTGGSALTAGGFNETGVTGGVFLDNDITSGGDGISFGDAVTVGANVSVTGLSALTLFGSTVDDTAANTENLTINSTTVVFDGDVGDTAPLKSLTVDGNITFNAPQFSTCGTQRYNGPVLLEAGVTLNATNITFGDTVDSFNSTARSLAVFGNAVFDGNVGQTSPVSTLTVVNTTTANAALFTTTGSQSYNGPVHVNSTVNFSTTGAATITFENTLDGGNDVTVTAPLGSARFCNSVGGSTALRSLTVNTASTSIENNVTTSGKQTYNGNVNVANAVVFNSTANGGVTFGNTLDGGNDVTVDTNGGNATFCGSVGGTTPLTSLTVDGSNIAVVNGNITTSGAQTYNEAVSVTNTVVFNSTIGSSSTNVTFCSSLDGGEAVTLDTANPSRVFFNGDVGDSAALSSLTVNGGSDVNGNITTSGAQTYNGAVDVFNTVLFNATTGGSVTFDSALLGGNPTTIDTNTGNAVFLGAVSEDSLTVNGSNHAVLNSDVRTSGDQTYNEAVGLTGDATLTGNTVTFDGAVGGPGDNLTINGATALNTANVNTSGADQTYCGAVSLLTGATLTGNTITFDGAVSGTNQDLTVVGTANLDASSVNTGTSGNQTYNGPVALGTDTTLTGNTVTFDGTVSGANTALTVQASAALDTNRIDTGTGGNQTYNGAVRLGSNLTLTGNNIALNGNVALGANTLTVNGNTSLSNASTLSASLTNATSNGEIVVQTGNLQLNSSPLSLTSSFAYSTGSAITLASVPNGLESGTFNGLPQGSNVAVGSNNFTISYTGGSGHNIVLTIVQAQAAPTVTSISPTSGPLTGGISVTVVGTSFTGVTAVNFGTTAATSFTVNSPTSITAIAPAGTAGAVDVTVTTASGTSATSTADQFFYGNSVIVSGFPAAVQTDLYGPRPSADANTAFVKGLYRAVLGRDGEPAGIAFWVNELTSNNATRAQVAMGFVNSTEHRVQQVSTYYQEILGRSATGDSGSNYWVNLLLADGDETEVLKGLLTSQEYTAQHVSDTAFVRDLYFRLLGRSADASGLTYWTNLLAGQTNRTAVIDSFLHSNEAANLLVGSYYAAFLQRPPDSLQNTWITQLTVATPLIVGQGGTGGSSTSTFLTYDQLAVDFLASSEFYLNAQQSVTLT